MFLARGRAAQVNATIVAERAVALLHRGYGDDGVPDLLAVVLRGPAGAMDRSLNRVERALRRAGRRVLLVVTATGSAPPSAPGGAEPLAGGAVAKRVEARVGALARRPSAGRNLVEATAAGGLFVDQRLLARRRLSEDVVVRALEGVRAGPRPVFVDEFPAIAVSFARYC